MRNYSGPGPGSGSAEIPANRLPRSAFDRSFSHSTTIDSAYLYPLFVEEVLPGDSLSVRPSVVFRLNTPLTPFMGALRMDWQFFYVPFRLVWDNFVKMMGERADPGDHIDYEVPQVPVNMDPATSVGTLWDYFGLPLNGGTKNVNALYSRAYALIWNEWFRDESLQDQVVCDKDDGPDDPADYALLKRGKRKDYIFGALPFAQKGDPVVLPLGTTAPVVTTGATMEWSVGGSASLMRGTAGGTSIHRSSGTWPSTNPMVWGSESGLETDLSGATATTINQMRQAVATQHLLERDARGGTRYRELILSHFGIQTSDVRLLRPRLLATGSANMEATQVAGTVAAPAIGELGAFAQAQGIGRSWADTFEEHGCVMGVFSVRTDVVLQQKLDRMWSRSTRYDYFWPDFQALGEQAVLSQEVYCDGTGDPDLGTLDYSVWGYQPRYQEYRERGSMISGEFRSQFATSLDIWHTALDFASRPVLNDVYIEENPPVSRLTVVTSAPEFKVDCYFRVKAVRPMARFATPGLLRF